MNIEAIRPATHEDIDAIAEVLSQAGSHKTRQGDYIWGASPFGVEEVGQLVEAGGLFAVAIKGAVSGTVIVTESDERVWGDDENHTNALYVHKLAAADEVRGRDIGGKILDWVAEKGAQQDKRFIRLDCSYTNQRLCNYYEDRGFTEVRRRDIPRKNIDHDPNNPTYKVALFQRDIKQTR